MTRFMLPVAAALVVASSASAFALESSVTRQSAMPPDVVWKRIGDFCGIHSWIPAVEKCVLTQDGKQRNVTLKGGGVVAEKLDKWDEANHSYSYSILSSPLPVDDYHSTLSVVPNGSGSTLKWMGTYKAKGASDAEAKKTIDGIYEAGAKDLLGS